MGTWPSKVPYPVRHLTLQATTHGNCGVLSRRMHTGSTLPLPRCAVQAWKAARDCSVCWWQTTGCLAWPPWPHVATSCSWMQPATTSPPSRLTFQGPCSRAFPYRAIGHPSPFASTHPRVDTAHFVQLHFPVLHYQTLAFSCWSWQHTGTHVDTAGLTQVPINLKLRPPGLAFHNTNLQGDLKQWYASAVSAR